MPEKDSSEKEEELEARKLWLKKTNKFLSDYFNWVVAFVIALVLLSGFFFLLRPKYEQTLRYIEVINSQEQFDFQAKKDELDKTKALLAAYDSIDPKTIERVKAIAPVRKNLEELFPEINYLISRNQLFLQSISIGAVSAYSSGVSLPATAAESKAAAKIESVSLSLNVQGISNYAVFKNFLTSLENNLHLIDVTNLSFSPEGSNSFIANIYFFKE